MANPARTHLRGFVMPRTQHKRTAETEVSLAEIAPNGRLYCGK